MVPWWWLILAGYGGVVVGFVLAAILSASRDRSLADLDRWEDVIARLRKGTE